MITTLTFNYITSSCDLESLKVKLHEHLQLDRAFFQHWNVSHIPFKQCPRKIPMSRFPWQPECPTNKQHASANLKFHSCVKSELESTHTNLEAYNWQQLSNLFLSFFRTDFVSGFWRRWFPRKFAHSVLFCLIKKHSYQNFACFWKVNYLVSSAHHPFTPCLPLVPLTWTQWRCLHCSGQWRTTPTV